MLAWKSRITSGKGELLIILGKIFGNQPSYISFDMHHPANYMIGITFFLTDTGEIFPKMSLHVLF